MYSCSSSLFHRSASISRDLLIIHHPWRQLERCSMPRRSVVEARQRQEQKLLLMMLEVVAVLLSICMAVAVGAEAPKKAPASLHIVFSTECNGYFDWQTAGLVYSHKLVGQRGNLTRLMACDDPTYDSFSFSGAPRTHVHPNMRVYNGDHYSPYNKPYAVLHWLEHADVREDFVVYIDADMVFRNAFSVEDLGAEKGSPVAAYYGYMHGVEANVHMGVKSLVKNVETAQKVGGFVVMHREDMKKVAPLWLKYTEMVRKDPDSWANTGDIFNRNGKGGPPWISEMYGYSFGAAEAGVKHKVSDEFMLYPGYNPRPEPSPYVMHYGLLFNVDYYAFDKHRYQGRLGDAVTHCPGVPFPRPPPYSSLHEVEGTAEHRTKMLSLYTGHVLHNATYELVRQNCRPDVQRVPYTQEMCSTDKNNVMSCHLRRQGEALPPPKCTNDHKNCCDWALHGECEKNREFMGVSCQAACKFCHVEGHTYDCVPHNSTSTGNATGTAHPGTHVAGAKAAAVAGIPATTTTTSTARGDIHARRTNASASASVLCSTSGDCGESSTFHGNHGDNETVIASSLPPPSPSSNALMNYDYRNATLLQQQHGKLSSNTTMTMASKAQKQTAVSARMDVTADNKERKGNNIGNFASRGMRHVFAELELIEVESMHWLHGSGILVIWLLSMLLLCVLLYSSFKNRLWKKRARGLSRRQRRKLIVSI